MVKAPIAANGLSTAHQERRPVSPETRLRLFLSRRTSLAARLALGFALVLALPGGAQNGGSAPHLPPTMGHNVGGGLDDLGNLGNNDTVEMERRMRALNAERQKSMVSDTDKLLKLANELNAEVATENPESPLPDELRKIAQIEKLAHSVKEKMSTSVKGTPSYIPPAPPFMH